MRVTLERLAQTVRRPRDGRLVFSTTRPDRAVGGGRAGRWSVRAVADAMTTDRPYAVSLDANEALLQIHAGRGKQFYPAVVDAFLSVVRRRPAEIMPPESSQVAAAAS